MLFLAIFMSCFLQYAIKPWLVFSLCIQYIDRLYKFLLKQL